MKLHPATVLEHEEDKGGYRVIVLEFPGIGAVACPGQFIHLKVPRLEASVLRRPFSIYRAEGDQIRVLYKTVGQGTRAMADIAEGEQVSVIGPLGNGFPVEASEADPVLVAGGYGVAPLSFLASRLAKPGVVFIGGRTADDILCVQDFTALGWDVQVATEDGSVGEKGFVTGALDRWLATENSRPEFYACGPDGMLKAIGDRAVAAGCRAWLSLDNHMGCGVGACLACVQKLKNEDGSERWGRVCKDGPIFEAREIVWTVP